MNAETAIEFEKPEHVKTLEKLRVLLLHPEMWPTVDDNPVEWDFSTILTQYKCGTAACAMGLGYLVWGERNFLRMLRGLKGRDVYLIFYNASDDRVTEVTPEMVAGRIEDYLAGRPIRLMVEGDRSEPKYDTIVTQYVYPPIPDRSHDWSATRTSYEPGDNIGFGRTEQDAIDDLLQWEAME